MAYTTITDPSVYFQTQLFTGTGSSLSVTNTGNADLQPDLVWIKNRDIAASHVLTDTTRGATKSLFSDQSSGESTDTQQLTSFNSDGFTVGTSNNVNGNGNGSVAWQWKANGGTTASNSDGSITSTVQANTTAGFSIVTYAGNGNNNQTIGHGLGATPQIIITKNRSAAYNWIVYHPTLAATKILVLDMSLAEFTPSGGYYSNVGSSTYQLVQGSSGLTNVNANGNNYVAYCFTEKKGYSKISSYKGNGNADGPFVYTGFKPAWVMIKNADASEIWRIFDDKRDTYNVMEKGLYPNLNNAEGSGTPRLDFLSNGFKLRDSGNALNDSGANLIYMAFAQNPLVASNNVIALAR